MIVADATRLTEPHQYTFAMTALWLSFIFMVLLVSCIYWYHRDKERGHNGED